METKYIDIPDKKWGIVIVYDFDTERERIDLLAIMRSFGLPLNAARKALRILSNYNTGMAVSLDELKMSAIFIGRQTDESQFWDTLNHEFTHVGAAIIDYYGEPYDGEGAAHLQGYLMQQAVLLLGEPCF